MGTGVRASKDRICGTRFIYKTWIRNSMGSYGWMVKEGKRALYSV